MALKALRAQNAHLAKLKDDLSEANAHLEARVEERTKELSAREASTRLLLNSMGDGVFEANAQGILVGERSKAVDAWFGDRLDRDGSRVWNILSGDTPGAVSVQLGWEQLFDGFLPFEVAADQIPHRFERDGRIFDVEYREGAQESTVLVVVRDWTADVAAERAERESREFQALVGNLLRDRKGFEITRDECAHLIEQLEQAEDLSETKKALHTLKGNTASYGFSAVAKRCHSMENTIAAEGVAPTASELAALRREWELSIRGLKEFIQSEEGSSIQVESEEVEQLCRLLSENKDREEVLRLVATWAHTPARSYLTRLERQARRAASRLAKEVDVRVNHNRVRVDSSLDPLWPSLIHLVRNSIDHGLESPEVREAEGKPRTGKLAFSVEKSDRSILIEVADDGAGIDEASLRARLGPKSEGLPLLQVIAHDGLSSKDEVTDHSGRGVGFGAVLSVVESLGGTVSVSTAVGKGTCVQLQLPLVDPTASDATAAA